MKREDRYLAYRMVVMVVSTLLFWGVIVSILLWWLLYG